MCNRAVSQFPQVWYQISWRSASLDTGPRTPKGMLPWLRFLQIPNTWWLKSMSSSVAKAKALCVFFHVRPCHYTFFLLVYLNEDGLHVLQWVYFNMIYLTFAMKRNHNSKKTKMMPARITLLQPVYFFLNHKSTKNPESLIMNVIYDCHKKFTLPSISIYPAINQRST